MATIHVWSASTDATKDGTTWAKAYTSVTSALAVATSSDVILVADDHAHNNGGTAITWSCPTSATGLRIISTNRTSGLYSAGASESVGAGGNSFNILGCAAIYGVTIASGTTASSAADINFANSSSGPHDLVFENCYVNQVNSNSGADIALHTQTASSTADESRISFRNTRFAFANTAQSFVLGDGYTFFEGCSFDSSSLAPSVLFEAQVAIGVTAAECVGCAWAGKAWSTLLATGANAFTKVTMWGCSMPSGWSPVTGAGRHYEITIADCAIGDSHGFFGYYNERGHAVRDTGVYFTGGAAAASWAITTTSAAVEASPFYTPWIDLYNTGTSAITPYIEILRNNDSTSAWTDAQVWVEVMVKDSSGSTLANDYTDRAGFGAAGAAQANGAGLGSWTGETGSCWSGKVGLASSVTPAEVGHIRARVGVAINTSNLYVDPQIRT